MKKKIDKYFTESYSELIGLATKHISYHNRSYDPVDVVSHVYEYCVSKEVEDVAGTCYRMIMTTCYWNNSALNRELLLKQTPFEGTEDFDAKPIEVDDCDTLEKIRLEKWFNNRKALLAMYRERIIKEKIEICGVLQVDKSKVAMFDKMIELRTTNSRKLGKHFGIHYLSAYAYIREIQEEIRDFEEEVNNYDNKNNLSR